eukprot:12170-Heterococcus_DN1.PRE.1
MPGAIGPAFDFLSSTIATTVCSVISTPQMVLTTRLMAGMYPNLVNMLRECKIGRAVCGSHCALSIQRQLAEWD